MSEVRTHRGKRIDEPEYQGLVDAARAEHRRTLDRAADLLVALHAAGFRTVLLESVLIGDTNPGYAYCALSSMEVDPAWYSTRLSMVAAPRFMSGLSARGGAGTGRTRRAAGARASSQSRRRRRGASGTAPRQSRPRR